MSGISIDADRRVFQTKEIARTKSYKHKRAQNFLSFEKQCSPGVEAQYIKKAGELEKKILARECGLWATWSTLIWGFQSGKN